MCTYIPLHICFFVRKILKTPSYDRSTESVYILSKFILLGKRVERE